MLQSKPEPPSISKRELEVARAYTGGKTYRQIADDLNIAPATVRTHLSNIYRKLEVSSKIELLHRIDGGAAPEAIAAPWTSRRWALVAVLALAAISAAFLTPKPPDAPMAATQMQSLALVPFVHDGNQGLRDTLARELVEVFTRQTELFVVIPSNIGRKLQPAAHAERLSGGIDIRFVLFGQTATRGDAMIVSAALFDRVAGAVIWQDEVQNPQRNALAIRLALMDSLAGVVSLPDPAQSRARCLEVIERDSEGAQGVAPTTDYIFQGQQPQYCQLDDPGPR